MLAQLLDGHSELVENGAAVGIPPGRIPQREKAIVQKRRNESAFARGHGENGSREKKDLRAGDEAQDLELTQLDGGDQTSNSRYGFGAQLVQHQ